MAEYRIRDAAERGEPDNLEGKGRPLPGLDDPYEPNWWIKKWMLRERQSPEAKEGLRDLRRQRKSAL